MERTSNMCGNPEDKKIQLGDEQYNMKGTKSGRRTLKEIIESSPGLKANLTNILMKNEMSTINLKEPELNTTNNKQIKRTNQMVPHENKQETPNDIKEEINIDVYTQDKENKPEMITQQAEKTRAEMESTGKNT